LDCGGEKVAVARHFVRDLNLFHVGSQAPATQPRPSRRAAQGRARRADARVAGRRRRLQV